MCHLPADVQEEGRGAIAACWVCQASTQDSNDKLETGWNYLVQECGLPRAIEPQRKPRYLDRKAKQGFYSPDFDDHSSESRKLLQKQILLLKSEPGVSHRASSSLTTHTTHACSDLEIKGGDG